VSGSHGFVGTPLIPFLKSSGHEVFFLVRDKTALGQNDVFWNPETAEIDTVKLESVAAHVIIHLAGDNIMGAWTEAKMKKIKDSRCEATRLLCKALAALKSPPVLFFCASGMNYYGNKTEKPADESFPHGKGFLADVAKEWEEATDVLLAKGTRVVLARISAVLGMNGGALGSMMTPFKLCLGGVLGDGTQWISWISMRDVLRAIDFIIANKAISGPVNFASPNAVTNYTFTKTLGRVLNRPTLCWVPKFVLGLSWYIAGDLLNETLLASLHVVPKKLLDAGFCFKDAELEPALVAIVSSTDSAL